MAKGAITEGREGEKEKEVKNRKEETLLYESRKTLRVIRIKVSSEVPNGLEKKKSQKQTHPTAAESTLLG